MATAFCNTSSSSNLHRLPHRQRALSSPPCLSPSLPFPPPPRLHRQTLLLLAAPGTSRRLAAASGPPAPPGPEPPPPSDTTELAGLTRAISRIQDRVKIFFAVLVWMSLFFWVSASDGRGKGKRKKGSRFK